MKYLIKINRSSVRRNPSTSGVYRIPGRARTEEIINPDGSITVSRTQDLVEMYSLYPPGKFDFAYEATLVACDDCGAVFPHTKLQSDSLWTGEDDIWLDNICPKCGVSNCCETEYERLSDIELEAVISQIDEVRVV